MINIVIAFDNQNTVLGQYFEDCQTDIRMVLDEQTQLVISSTIVPSGSCNEAYLDQVIPQLNSYPFVFIAYTHGIENGLRCNGSTFISKHNCIHFKNSLFYSTACLIGRELGPELINKGCRTFVGFNEESVVFDNATFRDIFLKCDNYALKLFMISDKTIGQSFEAMKQYYTSQIDRLMELGEDPVFIGSLTANREALICIGDMYLKKEDMNILE
jgi:hypothetical protein